VTEAATTPLVVTRLGAAGDGIAFAPDGRAIFVTGALPGEAVADGGAGAFSPTSPDRVTPPCAHAEACGGCVAQHMGDGLYSAWKRDIVIGAFTQHGLTPNVRDLVRVPPHSRRRATYSVTHIGGRWDVGFHERRSPKVIAVPQCPVVTPAITQALPVLAEFVAALGPAAKSAGEIRIAVADLDGGLDVAITGPVPKPNGLLAAKLAAIANRGRVARLTVGADTLLTRATPRLPTPGGAIASPPGAFFQAVAEAEAAILAAVQASLPRKPKRIADMFCGVGTLSLPLAQRASVFAVDSDAAALAALDAARRHAQGLKPIETRVRDLFREPLSPKELEPFDVVVLDPPRAGAKAQVEMLAKSKVATVVMVSCDPGTLARDCKLLADAGFKLGAVTPIDQFLWSNHVEAVVTLTR
jgi:23S rRNA (uracil1939-C5)-methyltransferase